MTTPPITDQPITATDPRVAQVLALIRAKTGQAPVEPTPLAPSAAQIAPPAPAPPRFNELGAPLQPMNELGATLPIPQDAPQAQPPAPTQPGPIKSFLQRLVSGLGTDIYAGSQGALQKLGLPTDYEKEQNALKIGLQQQQTDALAGLRNSQADLASGKAGDLEQVTVPNNPIFGGAAGQTVTRNEFAGILKTLAQNTGKTDVANIGATAKTDVAQTNADSRERLATAQLAVRQAIADRNYGLAASRLKLAGSNADVRQLEYRMRAYGTGADGKPLPGVEFDLDGYPVGTSLQTNVRPTTNARNAGERSETGQDIAARIQGALNDPEIRAQLGPITGRINDIQGRAGTLTGPIAELRNDLVSYGAFQSGLHPVRGIGALQYFDKVLGGLGQTPEELLGKITSNSATARSVQNISRGSMAPTKPSAPAASGKADYVYIPGKGLVKQ